jgi:hypothetical protein
MKSTRPQRKQRYGGWALGLLVLTGCGSATLPQAKIVAAESEIKAAETVGAAAEPRAALHLKLAREGMVAADALAKDNEEQKANLALQRAQIDAQLAVALTQETQARQRADSARQKITELTTK